MTAGGDQAFLVVVFFVSVYETLIGVLISSIVLSVLMYFDVVL